MCESFSLGLCDVVLDRDISLKSRLLLHVLYCIKIGTCQLYSGTVSTGTCTVSDDFFLVISIAKNSLSYLQVVTCDISDVEVAKITLKQ